MRTQQLSADFCVIGGGMAGVCAAVAAARAGLKTVLVQDRPVLGGNASSEIRVWIQGATASGGNRFAREGGIVNEIQIENLRRNPEANPYLFDAVLLDVVTREPNVTLLLNTAAFECALAAGGPRRIASVAAFNSFNQTRYEIAAPCFADCTGDGLLGFLAGAQFRMGREARSEYGEPWAPEQADALTLGDSMYFYSRRHDHPVKFIAPSFAIDITRAGIPQVRIDRIAKTAEPYACELWWLEYGGLLNAIYDAERIKWHLTGLVYGVWDYIKNSGKIPDTDTLTLEWVGSLPGKREGRRFLSDHVLTQQDVIGQRDFADGIGAAGWSVDLHPSGGIYSTEPSSMHDHADWVYNVPLRCLYSRNVDNLLLAGRLISASHVAFGSIRVMGTGAMTGQAIGTAAAQCVAAGVSPRQIAETPAQIQALRQRLLRDGQHIAGLANADPADLARGARVTASSTAVLDARTNDELGVRLAGSPRKSGGARLMLPLADPGTEWVELLVSADAATTLEYDLLVNDRIVNYDANTSLGRAAVPLTPGRQWIRIPLLPGRTPAQASDRVVPQSTPAGAPGLAKTRVPPDLTRPQNVWLHFAANPLVELRCQRTTTAGVLLENFAHRAGFHAYNRHTPCLRFSRPQALYAPANVIDGHSRPFVFPHAWVSEPLARGPHWLELGLPAAAPVRRVQLTLNANVDQLLWTQLYPADCRELAEVLRDFDVELFDDRGARTARFEVRGNYQALVRLTADGTPVRRVRITALAACDHDRAEIYEVRLYGS